MIAILHNIRSLHNVGSIFRTADGAGVEKIYLTGYTPAPVDRVMRVRQKLAKVSLGAERHVAWEKTESIGTLIKKLKKEEYTIYAIEQSKRAVAYNTIKKQRKKRIVFIVGNEVKGLSPAILKKADTIIEIPMHGKKESLNVGVAFGIVAFRLKECLGKSSA